jgi:diguanylate cyclase (GGDEF)-like protein
MPSPSQLSSLLAATGDVGYEWDLQADKIVWFGPIEKLFGVDITPPGNSQHFYNFIAPDDRHIVFGGEEQALDRRYRVILPGNSIVWVHERGSVDAENGKAVRQRGILRLTDKPQENIVHAEMHGRDPLTGCFDRAHMLGHVARAIEAATSSRRLAAYLVIGIDKMSFVNEAVGMEAGDALLRGVAETLAQLMPRRALLGRVGGDMFGILLPEPLGNDYKMLSEKILQHFRDQPVATAVTPLHITVSIGCVRMPQVAKTATEAMIFAEQALHDAHQRGRNLFVEYLDSPERVHENRQLLELSERIKHAFKSDGFRLAYQPIIEAATGQILFYEALVRMFDDKGAPIAAAHFVPAIEQLGLAFELDRRVLDLAVADMEAYPEIFLAINVSGLTAAAVDWPEHVRKVLGTRPHVARRLVIEITETAAIVDVGETRRFVESMRELGGRVALDDFGAGATSIRHLRTLSLSIMKIDKDLLHNLTTNVEQQHLVRMLIELARGLGLKTVAEGVETEDVADWLRREKIDMMQGYYFGRPSLDKPWISLRGAAAPPEKSAQMLGTAPVEGSPTTIRSASFV